MVLDVDGAVEKAKLDEFRNTNVSLLKERDDLKQRFEGIDPELAREALAERQRAEEDRLLKGSAALHPDPLPKAVREKSEQEKIQERERLEKVIEGRIKSVRGDHLQAKRDRPQAGRLHRPQHGCHGGM